MRIGFIYRGDPRHRTANRLSMLQNIAAANRLGHEVVLIIPREGMSQDAAQEALKDALVDFAIEERFAVKTILRPVIFGRGRRSFDLFATRWARKQQFDLVWSREIQAANYSSARGLTTILEHHHPFKSRQWKVIRQMLPRASFKGIAAISEVHRQMLVSGGCPADKVIAVHSGVDLAQFKQNGNANGDLRKKLGDGSRPVVLYAGSFFPGKGTDQLVHAARSLTAARFVCLGGREDEVRALRQTISSLGLTNIDLIGYLPHAQIPGYLMAADVLIAPFTEDGRDIAGKVIAPYASPLKLFEYMAAGRAIIASNVGAVPEVLRQGENALLVSPGNVRELVEAIARLLEDGALADRLSKTAKRDVQDHSWDARVARILKFASGRADTEPAQEF